MLKKIILVFTIVMFSLIVSTIRPSLNTLVLERYCVNYSLEPENFYSIPGLNTTYVPQGLCVLKNENYTYRLITAYDSSNHQNSCLYVISTNGEHIKTLFFDDSIGLHVGGITSNSSGSYVYICDSLNNLIRIYSADLIHSSFDGKIIKELISYPVEYIPSFISYDNSNNCLLIGSFSKNNSSKLVQYSLDLKKIDEILIPKRIQGVTKLPTGQLVLSQSYGCNNDSSLLIGHIENKKFYADSEITLPPGLEEIYCTENNNIFLLFESSAKKFKSMKPISNVILLLLDKEKVNIH